MSENAIVARLEARIAHLEEERERMLRERMLAAGRFSHDVRGPLNVIGGFAEFMLDPRVGALTVTQKEYLNEILASSRQLLEIAENLADRLSRSTPTRAPSKGA